MSLVDRLQEQIEDRPAQAEMWMDIASKNSKKLRVAENRALRDQRHIERMKRCGKWSAGEFQPETGAPKRYVYKCDLWREGCEDCLKERAGFVRAQFMETLASKELYVVEVSPDRAKKLIRKMNKEQYEKFPQEDCDLLIFEKGALNIEKLEGAEELTIQNAVTWNWEAVVKLPEGRNKSGSLTSPKTSTEAEKFSMITNKQIVTDAPENVQENMIQEVLQETSYLNPKNAKAVEKALARRAILYGKKLRNAGYNTFLHARKRKVLINKINWKVSHFPYIKDLTTGKMTKQQLH